MSDGKEGQPVRSSPLAGRTVAVTGAARGLGAAMAREIAGRGARLALLGHEKAALDMVAASLPGPALAIEVDVTDPAALDAAAAAVRAHLGPPSAVVANAGIAEGDRSLPRIRLPGAASSTSTSPAAPTPPGRSCRTSSTRRAISSRSPRWHRWAPHR